MYGADFWISSCGHVRNRTKSKIIGFSKTARWISSKIKLRGHFSILFQLIISKERKSKFEKIDFLKILPICTCKVEKNLKFFITWGQSLLKTDFFREFSTLLASVTWPRSKSENRFRLWTRLFICLYVAKNRLLISCKTATQCVPQEKTI